MSKYPKRIIVIRHAEKPKAEDNQHLSSTGMARAFNLVRWIPQTFGTIDFIYASAVSKESARPLETIFGLFQGFLNSHLDISIPDDKAMRLGLDLVDGTPKHLIDKTILICWHHGRIPELLHGMGANKKSYPKVWPEEDFSTVLDITFDENTGEPLVNTIQQPF